MAGHASARTLASQPTMSDIELVDLYWTSAGPVDVHYGRAAGVRVHPTLHRERDRAVLETRDVRSRQFGKPWAGVA